MGPDSRSRYRYSALGPETLRPEEAAKEREGKVRILLCEDSVATFAEMSANHSLRPVSHIGLSSRHVKHVERRSPVTTISLTTSRFPEHNSAPLQESSRDDEMPFACSTIALVPNRLRLCIAVMIVLTSYGRQVAAEVNVGDLMRVGVKKDGVLTTVLGELLSTAQGGICIRSLTSGGEQRISLAEIQSLPSAIGKDVAIRSVGVAPVLSWQIDRLMAKVTDASIAEVSPDFVLITIGKAQSVYPEMKLSVERIGKEIRDPVSGKVIGTSRSKIASLQIVDVQDGYSKAKVIDKPDMELRVGDKVTLDQRRMIAILPLRDAAGNIPSAGVSFSEQLTTALVRRNIEVVERTQIDRVIAELGQQQNAAVDADSVQKLGKQLGAYALLTGSLTSNGQDFDANLRLLETATGRILLAEGCRVNVTDGAIIPSDAAAVGLPFGVPGTPSDAVGLGGSIYIADESADGVFRTDFDGRSLSRITKADAPRGLAVDCLKRKVYWVAHRRGEIVRCNLDGSNLETIVKGQTNDMSGIAIDPKRGKIYWYAQGKIRSAALDGAAQTDVTGGGRATPPCFQALSVDADAGLIFWIALENGKEVLYSMTLDGAKRSRRVAIIGAKSSGSYLALDTVQRHAYVTLGENASAIMRVGYDGSGLKTVVDFPRGQQPNGIAVDGKNRRLIWGVIDGEHAVEAMNFDGSNRRPIVSQGLSRLPRGIGVLLQ